MENANPWSKIGQDVKGETNVQNALVKAGLDWNVKKVPMFFNGIDGVTTISDNFLNVRKDNQKQLGVVGNRYQIIQNTEAFEFMDRLFENHKVDKVSKRMISMTFDGSLDKFCINAEKLALEAANGTLVCF